MKITLLQEKLKEGLAALERVAGKSLSLPILSNVLLKTEGNFLCIEATDLEIGLKWWILAKNEGEGKIAVPAQLFSHFVSLLPKGNLEIETTDATLRIKHNGRETQIKGFAGEDFPIIPQAKGGVTALINSRLFSQGLSQVAGFSAYSSSRPEICGVYFSLEKKQLTIAATDSFRLGEKKLPIENAGAEECSFILPQKTCREAISIFGEREGQLKLEASSNQVMFELPMEETDHPQIQLVSKLIEGEYPNYQEILPKKFSTQVIFKKEEILEQIRIASLFGKKTNEIKLKIASKEQKVRIFSQNPELGEYKADISAQIKGQNLEISFNSKFLAEGLSSIKGSEVFFGLNGPEGAAIIKPSDNTENYFYIVMPIKNT